MSQRLLALDVGTQSVRAIVFDLAGDIVAQAQVPIEPYVSPQPGWAEQDPELYWRSLGEACARLWEQPQVEPAQIDALALTTQRVTMCCLDRDGVPLRPAIVWLDQRQARVDTPLAGPWRAAFKLADLFGLRASETIRSFRGEADSAWVAQQQPQLWEQTAMYCGLSGFLSLRLTGDYVDSTGAQVGYIPFDYKAQAWAGPRSWHWQALPIRPEQLPRLVPPGVPLGALTPEAAAHLGLPAGRPVIAAGADKACEVLGAGCVEGDQACLSFGTTATINTTQRRYREVIPLMPAYPAAMPERYCTEVQIYRGFWMVRWFTEQFAQAEQQQAAQQQRHPEELLDELIRDVPAGAMGLVLQPYWSPGVRDPGLDAKGAVIGFGDVHTRAHLYRAILEGLAYGLRAGKERTEARYRTRIKTVRIAGGGSQSDAAMQLTADIFGQATERPHTHEASALGAAISAAVGLGAYADHTQAVAAMTRPGQRFEPIAANVPLYDALYRKVYQRMYRQLAPLYKDIRAITGYPAPPGG